ncbi:MAG: aldose 1-epimerase family protein [Limnochordia bacterium]|jgi:hypothetical protein|nr:MAG: hypothetical protein AA931_04870 [Peptococcaceae bacterium 1109]
MKLWGRNYTPAELRRYFGQMSPAAGIRRFTYDEGRAKGLAALEVKTGAGLRFVVLVDKALDIGDCEFQGIPVALRTQVGDVAPQFYEPMGDEWFRSFGGGLLTTCGLTHLGAPDVDQGEALGLHGRIHNIPGEEVGVKAEWEEDTYALRIWGKVREAKTLTGSLCLHREITAFAGENRIIIRDVVTNESFSEMPHMILYHCNVGHPLLDEGTELVADSLEVRPRDEIAAPEFGSYQLYKGPTPNYPDTVFYHKVRPKEDDMAEAVLLNRRLDLGLKVRWEPTHLPNFIQWKYTGEGTYAAGLEPANCLVEGRSKERERGTLVYLKPGESRAYQVELIVGSAAELIG